MCSRSVRSLALPSKKFGSISSERTDAVSYQASLTALAHLQDHSSERITWATFCEYLHCKYDRCTIWCRWMDRTRAFVAPPARTLARPLPPRSSRSSVVQFRKCPLYFLRGLQSMLLVHKDDKDCVRPFYSLPELLQEVAVEMENFTTGATRITRDHLAQCVRSDMLSWFTDSFCHRVWNNYLRLIIFVLSVI